MTVAAGDNIYFRVGSLNDGANDDVDWSPTISYTAIDGVADISTVPLDVNGLSQVAYVAADDFTVSGRPDTLVFMPFQGTVHFSATIDKLATTDDVRVVLLHNGNPVPVANDFLAASFTGQQIVTADFNVAAPVLPPDENTPGTQDSLTVKLVTDSPIDLHAITWDPAIAYTSGVDGDGNPLPNPGAIYFAMTPEIEQYPGSSPASPSQPWRTSAATTRDAHLTFATDPLSSPAGTAIVTVKTSSGVVARATVNVPASLLGVPVTADADLNVALQADTDYWFDVSIRDPEPLRQGAVAHRVHPHRRTTRRTTSRRRRRCTGPGARASSRWPTAVGPSPATTLSRPTRSRTAPTSRCSRTTSSSRLTTATNRRRRPIPAGATSATPPHRRRPRTPTCLLRPKRWPFPASLPPIPTLLWVGNRANLSASATVMRSSRLGADSVTLAADSTGGAGRAVTRVSITAPSAKLAFGVGPAGASLGIAPSFGLVDFVDMNGDGFPDVITPSSVTYTTQRGAYRPSGVNPGELAVTNQDLTIAVSAGFESGLVDITANAKGKTNATQGGAAGKGSDADDSGGGISLGASVDAELDQPQRLGRVQ